jgi:hypothetical protein
MKSALMKSALMKSALMKSALMKSALMKSALMKSALTRRPGLLVELCTGRFLLVHRGLRVRVFVGGGR